MDVATAKTVVYGIASIGAVVWFCSLLFLQRAGAVNRRAHDPDRALLDDGAHAVYRQSFVVDGRPDELLDKATSLLIAGGVAGGAIKILERTDNAVSFEQAPDTMQHSKTGAVRCMGTLTFRAAASNRTEITQEFEMPSLPWLLRIGWIFQWLGLAALIGGAWALSTYVATSANAGVRGQAFQMVQAVHLLWPPFLLGGLYSHARKATLKRFETFAHNLPYA